MGEASSRAVRNRNITIRIMEPGETVSSLARQLAAPGNSPEDIEALLRANNGLPASCTSVGGQLLCMDLSPLEGGDRNQWIAGRSHATHALRANPRVGRLIRDEPGALGTFARFSEVCDNAGWCTGGRIAQVAGYAAGGGSAFAFTMEQHLGAIARMADDVREQVIAKFGHNRSPFGLSRSQTPALGEWLKSNPTYQSLRRSLDDLPRYLGSRLGAQMPSAAAPAAAHGSWLRSQIVVPHTSGNPGAYVGRVARRLGGEVLRYGKIGGRLTWYVPAVLGVYETARAAPGTRTRTAAGQAGGILMGAVGTAIGGTAAIVVLASVAPGVVVLAASVAAGAYLGYQGFELGKSRGESLFDWFTDLDLEPLRRIAFTILR